jgi:hypothetical protein
MITGSMVAVAMTAGIPDWQTCLCGEFRLVESVLSVKSTAVLSGALPNIGLRDQKRRRTGYWLCIGIEPMESLQIHGQSSRLSI